MENSSPLQELHHKLLIATAKGVLGLLGVYQDNPLMPGVALVLKEILKAYNDLEEGMRLNGRGTNENQGEVLRDR